MTSILLVGCGKMGGALLSGWCANGAADSFVIVEPNKQSIPNIGGNSNITFVQDFAGIPSTFLPDAIVMAVKPQAMNDVVPAYTGLATSALTLSIAAGTPISFFEALFGTSASIVRAMPNTPAAIGRGMSVLCANKSTTDNQKKLAEILMQAAGAVEWIADENLMDAVTALSGSGPAYVFHLIEAMASAGEALGLKPELAAKAALQTVAGAGELARLSSETPSVLRQNVTSPGGTTAAALDVLMAEDGLRALMERAMTAARDRGRELGAG
jgi:pyrroline-5-carboxylate reductase